MKYVRYASGPKEGQLVAPDIDPWFQEQPAAEKSKAASQVERFCRWHWRNNPTPI